MDHKQKMRWRRGWTVDLNNFQGTSELLFCSAFAFIRKVCFFILLLTLFAIDLSAQSDPGGIPSRLWLKANDGAALDEWLDRSQASQHLTEVGGTPQIINNVLNFNPVVRFTPGDYYRLVQHFKQEIAVGFASRTFYTVHKASGSGDRMIVFYGTYGTIGHGWGSYVNDLGNYSISYGGTSTFQQPFESSISASTGTFDLYQFNYEFIAGLGDATLEKNAANPVTTSPPNFSLQTTTVQGTLTVGADVNDDFDFEGDIAEIVAFGGVLTEAEQQRVESYLALKYGISLNQDYVASDGVTEMWDKQYGAASTYFYDVAGIGRDDDSGLTQLKSTSQNSDGIVIMEAESTGNVADLEFLTWGNDDAALTESNSELSGNYIQRISREWQVQETGDVGNVTVSIVVSQSMLTGKTLADFTLLVDTDGDFSNGFSSEYAAATYANDTVTFTGVDFSQGDYFTLATASAGLLFTEQPTNTKSPEDISPAIAVSVVNSSGVVQTELSYEISLSINNNPPGDGVLDGTTTVFTSNGIATFSGLSIDELGNGYTLNASATGLETVTSDPFNITIGDASQLIFGTQPTDALVNSLISPAVTVSVADGNGNTISGDNGRNITLSIASGMGNLSGTLTGATLNGTSTFSDLQLDLAGDFSLDAISVGLTSATSNIFTIHPTPGGVSAQIGLWLKANAGTSTTTDDAEVTSWIDQSEQGNSATKPTTGDYRLGTVSFQNETADQFNFNPVLDFKGVSQRLRTAQFLAKDVIIVSKVDNQSIAEWAGIFGYGPDFGIRLDVISNSESIWIGTAPGGLTPNNDDWVSPTGGETQVNGVLSEAHGGIPHISFHRANAQQNQQYDIGGYISDSRYAPRVFDGQVAEVIAYSTDLSALDLDKIQSYLAIKYGVTLNQSSGLDYYSSGGAVIWDHTLAGTYNHDITGIGKDANSCLEQKQSKSVNSDAIVTIGLSDGTVMEDGNGLGSTNSGNSGVFSADKSFLTWSNDGATLESAKANTEFNSNDVNSRIEREWFVQETGSIGDVVVQFDVSNLPGPEGIGTNDESKIVLMVDRDGDFSAGVTLVYQSFTPTQDGQVNFIVNFDDGDYFTLGSTEFGALPIELLSFTSRPDEQGILLKWSTASEINHSYFRIDRAGHHIQFEPLVFVEPKGKGGDGGDYMFLDSNPLPGPNYYRLVDVDLNGVENFSEIIRSYYVPEELQSIRIYPNPASGESFLISIPNQVNGSVKIYDAIGNIVGAKKIETITSAQDLEMHINSLSSGVYFVQVLLEDGRHFREKLIVSK